MDHIEHLVKKPAKRTQATPILFVHGAWHSAWCWSNWMEYFAAQGFETHAISMPGHGNSTMTKPSINFYNPSVYLDVLAREIEAISPTPAVVGHSVGGGLMLKYLETRQLPAAVFLAGVPTSGMWAMLMRMMLRYPGLMLKSTVTMNLYHLVKDPAMVRELFLNPDTSVDVVEYQKHLARETFNMTSLIVPFGRVNPVKSPMLFVAGEKDNLLTVREEAATARRYGEELLVIPGQPHSLMVESGWQSTAERVIAWLVRVLG